MAMHQVCAENFQICAFLSSHYKYTSKMVAWFYAQLNDAAIPHIQFYTAAYDRYDEDACYCKHGSIQYRQWPTRPADRPDIILESLSLRSVSVAIWPHIGDLSPRRSCSVVGQNC